MSKEENRTTPEDKGRKKKRFFWPRVSYTSRLTVSFAAIAVMTAMVAIGVLSFVWEEHFHNYTKENMQQTANEVADRIGTLYEIEGEWSETVLSPAKTDLRIRKTVGVEVKDSSMVVRYDSTVDVEGGEVDSSQLTSLAPSSENRVKAQIKITDDVSGEDKVIGTVSIWMNGQDTFLSPRDIEYRERSYQAMIFATVIAVVLALAIGFLFARNLVRPINRMTKTAKAIKEGDLSARTDLRGEDEISKLGETFDEMAESVEKDRKLERRLTTDVAHELRTPLMAIQSTVEAMVDGVFMPTVERLETVNSEVERLSRLVDALLKLTRLENRATPMKEEVIDVGELVMSIVSSHEAYVLDSGLTMEYHGEPDVYIYGDGDMIRQATTNLISNAVRYTPEGGHITMRVKKGDIMASISVSDTGIGLTPEEAKMVFSRFWRADEGRNRESGGLGIGLSVVKEIIDRHGGWVHVEGKEGEGATFTLYIPLFDEERIRNRNKEKRSRARGSN